MKTTDLKINSRTTIGDDVSLNIPYANPNASDAALRRFSEGINGLTSNTFVSAQRIDRIELEGEGE